MINTRIKECRNNGYTVSTRNNWERDRKSRESQEIIVAIIYFISYLYRSIQIVHDCNLRRILNLRQFF